MSHCRRMFPSEVAAMILAQLLATATKRNEEKSEQTKISVTVQTDDSERPDIIKIDVDHPTDSEKMAIRNRYLSRLEIHKMTGEVTFFPDGYRPDDEKYGLRDTPHILQCMRETIRTATT